MGKKQKDPNVLFVYNVTYLCTFGSAECYLASLKTCSDMQEICIVTTQGMQAMKIFINQAKIDKQTISFMAVDICK